MLKFVSTVVLVVAISHEALAQQETTTSSGFQNFFKKIQEAGSNVDFAKLSAGAVKAQETLGPLLNQFKNASQPFVGDIQKKLADSGIVPTTTANPLGGVLKHLQVVGIGSDIDVAKVQENAKKAQDTFSPIFNQFSSFINKKNSNTGSSQPVAPNVSKSPIDEFIIEDPVTAAAAPAVTSSDKPNNFQNTLQTIQNVGSKIDMNQVQEGAKKLGSFFSQFSKNSGTS